MLNKLSWVPQKMFSINILDDNVVSRRENDSEQLSQTFWDIWWMSEISMVLPYFLWLLIFRVMRIQRWLRFCNVSQTHVPRLSPNKSIQKICLVRNFWSVAILSAKYNISDDVDLCAFSQVPDSKTRKPKPTAYKSISQFQGGAGWGYPQRPFILVDMGENLSAP